MSEECTRERIKHAWSGTGAASGLEPVLWQSSLYISEFPWTGETNPKKCHSLPKQNKADPSSPVPWCSTTWASQTAPLEAKETGSSAPANCLQSGAALGISTPSSHNEWTQKRCVVWCSPWPLEASPRAHTSCWGVRKGPALTPSRAAHYALSILEACWFCSSIVGQSHHQTGRKLSDSSATLLTVTWNEKLLTDCMQQSDHLLMLFRLTAKSVKKQRAPIWIHPAAMQ